MHSRQDIGLRCRTGGFMAMITGRLVVKRTLLMGADMMLKSLADFTGLPGPGSGMFVDRKCAAGQSVCTNRV